MSEGPYFDLGARYFTLGESRLVRQQTPSSCPEIYDGHGKWRAYPYWMKVLHDGVSITREEFEARMAALDASRQDRE